MTNILDLTSYEEDITLKLKDKTLNIPPLKVGFCERFIRLTQQGEKLKEKDILNLILEFLNSNREEEVFKEKDIKESFNSKQITAILKFIANTIIETEKK